MTHPFSTCLSHLQSSSWDCFLVHFPNTTKHKKCFTDIQLQYTKFSDNGLQKDSFTFALLDTIGVFTLLDVLK